MVTRSSYCDQGPLRSSALWKWCPTMLQRLCHSLMLRCVRVMHGFLIWLTVNREFAGLQPPPSKMCVTSLLVHYCRSPFHLETAPLRGQHWLRLCLRVLSVTQPVFHKGAKRFEAILFQPPMPPLEFANDLPQSLACQCSWRSALESPSRC